MKRRISASWARTRHNHLIVYPECRACGNKGEHVHHLRYRGKRGESERPGDLVTLCAGCHSELHRWLGKQTTSVQGTIDFCRKRREAVDAEVGALLDRALYVLAMGGLSLDDYLDPDR